MTTKVIQRKMNPEDVRKLDPNGYEFKFRFEIGPAFAKGQKLTLKQLAEQLEQIAEHRKGKPLAGLFDRLAEHIRFEAASMDAKQKSEYLATAAHSFFNAVYYGCGSCAPGCCWCGDGTNFVCEQCC